MAKKDKYLERISEKRIIKYVLTRKDLNWYRKNKILIRGNIELDKGYLPENGFAAKLFSELTVEVDSQTVSKNCTK